MKQLCTTDTSVLAFFMDDIFSICIFLASHPLHLAYVIFFSPYILSFLSFFFPLLFSTSLLLLVLMSISPYVGHSFHESPLEFLGNTCCMALDAICMKPQPDGLTIGLLEKLQSIVLVPEHEDMLSLEGVPILELKEMGEFYNTCFSLSFEEEEESPVQFAFENSIDQEKSLSHENVEEFKEAEPLEFEESIETFNHKMEAQENAEENSPKRSSIRRRVHSRRASECLQSEESMKKEKDWNRTLACKIYEERMALKLCQDRAVVDGSDNMDMLWEAYEVNGSKDYHDDMINGEVVKDGEKEVEVEEEEEDQEDEGPVRQLCCLQALKFSTRKMTVGVGKSNLRKVSKLLKRMTTFSSIGTKKSRL